MAKSGTEDVDKKDPAAEKAPDAGAVDSDKAKAMFAAHAPRPTAVFWEFGCECFQNSVVYEHVCRGGPWLDCD